MFKNRFLLITYQTVIRRSKKTTEKMKEIKVRVECDPSIENIEVVIRAAERDMSVQQLSELIASVSSSISAAGEFGKSLHTMQVYDDEGNLKNLNTEEIISVSVNQKVVSFVTEKGVLTSRQSLQSLEAELDPDLFVRISRYEIINISKVVRYDFTLPGTLRIEMDNSYETWASRRSIPLIRQRLDRKEGQKRKEKF